MYSAFHPSGVGTMSRGNSLCGDESRTFTKGLKRIGTNQGFANSQLGGAHLHAIHARGRFGTSVERLGSQVCQGKLSLPSFRGRYISRGNLRLAMEELLSLTKGLKTWELSQWARRLLQWNSGNGRNCHPQSSVSPRGEIQWLQSSFMIVLEQAN